jgi:ankyrin repeat protein
MLCQIDYSSLISAVNADDQWCVLKLANEGADVNARTAEGGTLLHVSVMRSQVGTSTWLLEFGADVNARDRKGWTPLHYAARQGDVAFIRSAYRQSEVEDRAFMSNLQTPAGESALHLAALADDGSVGSFLVEQGANLELREISGKTPLHSGVVSNNYDLVEVLLASGANVNSVDRNGDTPLHIAALNSDPAISELLLSGGARNDRLDADGESPSKVAETHGNEETAAYIVAYKSGSTRMPPASADSERDELEAVRTRTEHFTISSFREEQFWKEDWKPTFNRKLGLIFSCRKTGVRIYKLGYLSTPMTYLPGGTEILRQWELAGPSSDYMMPEVQYPKVWYELVELTFESGVLVGKRIQRRSNPYVRC